ncbi:MAG: hypothetical protein PSV22_04500 [Pseudolabrys sp.]|nr:hypothetical protein [Pseudolabrys sp.]
MRTARPKTDRSKKKGSIGRRDNASANHASDDRASDALTNVIAFRPAAGRPATPGRPAKPERPAKVGRERRGHPGGDTTAAARGNHAKILRHLEKLRKDKAPLPANARRPGRVSMPDLAREAGIDQYALLRRGSQLRRLVEAAVPKLGVGVRLRCVKEAVLRIVELETAAIARVRNENSVQGFPSEQGTRDVRRLCHAIARLDPQGAKAPAAPSLERAHAALASGTWKISRTLSRLLTVLSSDLAALEACNGLPPEFSATVSVVCIRAGFTLSEVARRVGAPPQTVINWAAGRKNPDRRSIHIVHRIEELVGIEKDVLVSRIRRMRAGQGRMAADLFPQRLRGRQHARERSAISRLLPQDVGTMTQNTRYRLIEEVVAGLGNANRMRRRRGACIKAPYALEKFPSGLETQWQRLKRHKQSPVAGPGIENGKLWAPGTASIWRARFGQLFGYAALQEAGAFRTQFDGPGFQALANPEFVRGYLEFKAQRSRLGLEDTPADELAAANGMRLTPTDLDLLTQSGSFFRRDGWIRQDPEMRRMLASGKSHDEWQGRCASIAEQYRDLERDLRKKFKRMSVADHGAVEAILAMAEPMTAIKMLIDGLIGDLAGLHEHASAAVLQDLVWTLLQAQAPLRPGTWAYVELSHIKRDDEGFFLEIPRQPFKNRNGAYFRNHTTFKRRLTDDWGLNKYLEMFLEQGRAQLLDDAEYPRLKLECPYLFIYGKKYLSQEIEDRESRKDTIFSEERDNKREVALATRVRAFTARHLGYNAASGTGIKGITALSPTAFRHIVATSLIKRYPRHPEIAADAIADSVQVTLANYARYLPEDRRPLLETAMAEARHGATKAARDLAASRPRKRPRAKDLPLGGARRRRTKPVAVVQRKKRKQGR